MRGVIHNNPFLLAALQFLKQPWSRELKRVQRRMIRNVGTTRWHSRHTYARERNRYYERPQFPEFLALRKRNIEIGKWK